MKLILYVIACIFLFGCTKNKGDYAPTPKPRLVYKVASKVFHQLKNHGLYPIVWTGCMMDEITSLHLGFFCYRETNIAEARQLLLIAGNTFLQAINEDEKIRPYLKNYPFLLKDIEIEIYFKNPDGSEIGYDKLHVALLRNGKMDYDTVIEQTNRLTTLCQETFEEAESKLDVVSF